MRIWIDTLGHYSSFERSMHNNDASYHNLFPSTYYYLQYSIIIFFLNVHTAQKLFLLLNLWSIKIIPQLLFGYNTEYNHKDLSVSCELEFPLSFSNPLHILLLQNLSRLWYINQDITAIWCDNKQDVLKDWVTFDTSSAASS